MASISLMESSRASTHPLAPSSYAKQAAPQLATPAWVETCTGMCGVHCFTQRSTPQSATIKASAPAARACCRKAGRAARLFVGGHGVQRHAQLLPRACARPRPRPAPAARKVLGALRMPKLSPTPRPRRPPHTARQISAAQSPAGQSSSTCGKAHLPFQNSRAALHRQRGLFFCNLRRPRLTPGTARWLSARPPGPRGPRLSG